MNAVYKDLLEWSRSIPDWQRDALRRLVHGTLSESDHNELLYLCLSPFGIDMQNCDGITAQPVTEKDLPLSDTSASSVTLTSIRSVRNINLLHPDSELTFIPNGLTIIYGDNGSGKSGYTRILKKVCRARDVGGPICPNIFEEPTNELPTATIVFAATADANEEYQWRDGDEAPPELSRISIFDSDCAEFYVTAYNDIAYRPFGLDLFDQLAQLADELRTKIEQQAASLPSRCPALPSHIGQAPVIKLIFPLKETTKIADIKSAAHFASTETEELKTLRKTLNEESPSKKAAALRARKGIIEGLVKRIQSICAVISDASFSQVREHITALAFAQETERLVSREAFADCLPGTGSDAWKNLWSYARAYSEQLAYVDVPFPNVQEDAKCVLCQQPLSDDAKKRLSFFEDYVRNESAKKVMECQAVVAADKKKASELPVSEEGDESAFQSLMAHDMELAEEVKTFLKTAATTKERLIAAMGSNDWSSVCQCAFDISSLDSIAAQLETEAMHLISSQDQEALQRSQARLLELEAKEWLHNNLAALESEVARLLTIGKLKKASKTTETTAISRKASDLTKVYVTEDLETKIKAELEKINANDLKITISRKTTKGITSHRVDIEGKKIQTLAVKDIVSEGEFRAIALAAFFAELSQSPDRSAIVVDDPVCSLDHMHRRRVADRLVHEATSRQVIILTHDLVFLNELLHATKEEGLDSSVCQVTRSQDCVGVVCEGLPWHGKPVSKRIGTLKSSLQSLRKLHKENEQVYRMSAHSWYGDLRETWERAVEELVLNGVVLRFSRAIQTKRLKVVTDLTEDDYRILEAGMSKTSTWLKGHDQPMSVNESIPSPDELEADLKALESYVDDLTKRRKRQPDARI